MVVVYKLLFRSKFSPVFLFLKGIKKSLIKLKLAKHLFRSLLLKQCNVWIYYFHYCINTSTELRKRF